MPEEREGGPAILPDDGQQVAPDAADAADSPDPSLSAARGLLEDVEDLLVDAKTYFDAELSYQKTRAGFVGSRLKRTLGFAFVAICVAIFATIGLTVGLIVALTPLITAWGATAVVVGALLLIAFVLVRKAGRAWSEMMDAINEDKEGKDRGNG